jgi:uncharacterized paraquat-inducible protein A
MSKPKPWYRRAIKNLRKRWVQVLLAFVTGAFAVAVTARILIPRSAAGIKDKEAAGYKFLHCNQCMLELAYNAELDGKRCPKCQPPRTGFFVATKDSIRSGGDVSPNRWFYVAAGIEALATLGAVVYIAYLPTRDPTQIYYVFHCPECDQRLRFREVSLGELGQCPRCENILRFPDEDDAVREDVAEEWHQQMLLQAAGEDDEG